MNLADLPDALKEALACHEAFRRLGFPAENIFVLTYKDDPHVQVQLRVGVRSFTCDVGLVEMDREQLYVLWAAAIAAWNSASDITINEAIWHGSHIKAQAASLLIALHAKGFRWLSAQEKAVLN